MKKLFSLLLAAALTAALAACGAAPDQSEPAVSEPAVSEPAASEPADSEPALPMADEELAALVEEIYAEQPLDLALELAPIDLTDRTMAAWAAGLVGGDVLDEAEAGVVSTSLINAQAYSMTLLRLKEGADLAAAGQALADDANAQKWVCVFPDKAAVAGNGRVLCLVLADDELIDAEALTDAFAAVTGGAEMTAVREFSEEDLGEVWDPSYVLDVSAAEAAP